MTGLLALLMIAQTACEKVAEPVTPGGENPDSPELSAPDGQVSYSAKDGVEYMFDGLTVPKIHIEVSLDEWNKLLAAYDRDPDTKDQIVCAVTYDKAGEVTVMDSVAIRLRGNTSRRRPEGSVGQVHEKDKSDWHHCHFQLNFRKFVKDDAHELHGARKVILKWFKDDPMYVREVFCYDLFRRFGVWTGTNSAYCQLYLHVEGDSKETYFGVYEMVEPIDERFIKVRKEQFGSTGGFLWKCRWGATLSSPDSDFGADDDSGREYTYELKNNIDQFATAESQLKDFIAKLSGKGDESFAKWFPTVCDVPLLLKTYAVNVAVGMWDDYWNNSNNYYH